METIVTPQETKRASAGESNPGIVNLLLCKCPRCRKGNMFEVANPWRLKTTMKMNDECPVCGQPLNLEVGFYYGSSYISYAMTIALSVATFVAWWIFVGISVNDNRVLYWIPFNAMVLLILQPYLMRVGRTGWLAFFVNYDSNWRNNPPVRPERTNKEMEKNW